MKVCSRCQDEKELDDFYKKKDGKDGRRAQCKTCVDAANTAWANKNPSAAKAIKDRYFTVHPGAKARIAKKFNSTHPERQRDYQRRQYAHNPHVRLARRLRGRIRDAIKKGRVKAGSAVADLGCTVPELRTRLESMFYPHPITGEPMNWGNYGPRGWHIDHKRPLADFDLTDRVQFLEAINFMNLQPLWAEQNWSKGSSSVPI